MPNTSQTPRLHTTRLTIGMLFENMPNEQQEYLSQVLAGVTSVAEAQDVNLLCFTGGHLYHTFYNQFDTQRNILYELVSEDLIDGLIILGTIITYAPMPKTLEFYRRFDRLPLVHIGLPVEGFPTVVAAETAGLYAAVTHLIRDHHYHRIAFINSPENRPPARPRYQAYAQALTDHGIAVDPALVVPGDWTVRAGGEAVELLLDQRQVDVQAIVASNDNMALGALAALHARGIHVPYDMALVGFDDTRMGQLAMPSLTTVHQSIFELGAQALTLLLAKIAGEEVPQEVLLPTKLIIRQSCGCPDPTVARAIVETPLETPPPADPMSSAAPERIIAEVAAFLGATEEVTGWLQDLFAAFMAEIDYGDTGDFMATLDKTLRQVIHSGGDLSQWQDVISMLRCRLHPCFGDATRAARAENLWHQARVFIGEAMRKALAQRQLQVDQQNISMRIFGQVLMATFEFDTLLHIIAERLPELGIPSCHIALYEDPQPYAYPQPAPEWSRLVLTYHRSPLPPYHVEVDTTERRFRSRLVLPPELWPRHRRFTLIVEPLYFQNDQLGFAVLEMGTAEGPVYESVREQVSSALKSVLLFQEQKQAEAALVQAYAHVEQQVQARTRELEQEISERKQAQAMQQTLIAELKAKNAELERFTYTVSHDLKSPLITISGFTGFLEQDVLAGDVECIREDIAHINAAVARMKRLLDELLELSRIGRIMNPPEEVAFADIVGEAIEMVRGCIEACGIVVEVAPDLPIVYGDRVRLVEVVQNLLDNACKFMGEQPRPRVEIGTCGTNADGKPILFVRDNGIGIDPQYHDKIFGLFNKLDPQSEGTGIGLALVKAIVEVHGGSIWIESELGAGTTFYFTLAQKG